MLKVQIPIELEMDERHQDLPVAKAPLMGIGDVMMWKSNEDDALAAFTLCKPDRTVEGDGLIASSNPRARTRNLWLLFCDACPATIGCTSPERSQRGR